MHSPWQTDMHVDHAMQSPQTLIPSRLLHGLVVVVVVVVVVKRNENAARIGGNQDSTGCDEICHDDDI